MIFQSILFGKLEISLFLSIIPKMGFYFYKIPSLQGSMIYDIEYAMYGTKVFTCGVFMLDSTHCMCLLVPFLHLLYF